MNKKKINLILTFFLLSGLVISGCSKTFDTVELDKYLSYCYENGFFNGNICVMQNDNILYENAFGFADFKTKEKLTTEYAFYLASVSKQFTTMAVMILKERGSLDYNNSLSEYFPQFPQYAERVKIKNLMSHTSGIGDHFELGAYKPDLTNADVLDLLINQDSLNFEPGSKYQYSNGAFVLLALIVEKVSGMPYHIFIKENIFNPLGMNNTLVYDESKPLISKRAIGHNESGEVDDYNILTSGAGGMYSTVEDLAKWNVALLENKIVKAETLNEAYSQFKLNDGSLIEYGYGWRLKIEGTEKIVSHGGNLSGFRTYIERNLTNNMSFFYLTNYGNSIPIEDINEGIRNIINNKPYSLPSIK